MKKILFILTILLSTMYAKADRNVHFGTAPCIRYNSLYGYYVEMSYTTYSCTVGGYNFFAVWFYHNGTAYGPNTPSYMNSNTILVQIPAVLQPYLAAGECIDVAYKWRCISVGTLPNDDDLADPLLFGATTVQLCPCPSSPDDNCIAGFQIIKNTDDAENGIWPYQLNDNEYPQIVSYSNQLLSNFLSNWPVPICDWFCGQMSYNYDWGLLVTDKWEITLNGVTSTYTYNSYDHAPLYDMSTFSMQPITFIANINDYYTICHTKSVAIACLNASGPLPPDCQAPNYHNETVIYECQTCMDECFVQPESAIIKYTEVPIQGKPGKTNSEEMAIYPNPNQGSFSVELSVIEASDAVLELLDLSGKSILKKNTRFVSGKNKETVNTVGLANGAYQLRLSYPGKTIHRQIIIQH